MKIAIGQLWLHWTIEENMASILRATAAAADLGATICSFPELAITGFHREIRSLARPELVAPQVQAIQALCRRRRIAVAVGAPTFGDGDARFNSHLLIDERGELVATIAKIGLTAPEATFFRAGSERPVAELHRLRCSAVICREIEDHADVAAQLQGADVSLLFWPGQMRPDPDKPPVDPPAHVAQAQCLAHTLRAHVVQTNWSNAVNRPEESAEMGHSAVIGAGGELLFRLPKEVPGLAVFALGARDFDWTAL